MGSTDRGDWETGKRRKRQEMKKRKRIKKRKKKSINNILSFGDVQTKFFKNPQGKKCELCC